MREKDYTVTGLRIEGQYENDRNADSADLFKAIIREAYEVKDVIIGHHLIYVKEDRRPDGFTYQVVQEIPSADALCFDHEVMQKIFPETWESVLHDLAMTPADSRDQRLSELYYSRVPAGQHSKVKTVGA